MKKVSEISYNERMTKVREYDAKVDEYNKKCDALRTVANKIADINCKNFLVRLAAFYNDKSSEAWFNAVDYSCGIDDDLTGLFDKEFSEANYSHLNAELSA